MAHQHCNKLYRFVSDANAFLQRNPLPQSSFGRCAMGSCNAWACRHTYCDSSSPEGEKVLTQACLPGSQISLNMLFVVMIIIKSLLCHELPGITLAYVCTKLLLVQPSLLEAMELTDDGLFKKFDLGPREPEYPSPPISCAGIVIE